MTGTLEIASTLRLRIPRDVLWGGLRREATDDALVLHNVERPRNAVRFALVKRCDQCVLAHSGLALKRAKARAPRASVFIRGFISSSATCAGSAVERPSSMLLLSGT